MQSLYLLNNMLRTDSAAKRLNILMLRIKSGCPQLLNRVLKICNSQNINFTLLLTCKDYVNS